MRRRKTGAFKLALLLFACIVLFLGVFAPGTLFAILERFWGTAAFLIGIVSIEAATAFLRGIIGVSSRTALLVGFVWVNFAWMWWTFLFSTTRFLGAKLHESRSRHWVVRYLRVHLKLLIRFASEKSQSKHAIVRFLRGMVETARGNRRWLVLLFFAAGLFPHADIAAIFVAVTYQYPTLFTISASGVPIFRFPRLVFWTALAMNLKIVAINAMFGM